MKTAQTEHQRFILAQMRGGKLAGQQIEAQKAHDHQQVGQDTALGITQVSCPLGPVVAESRWKGQLRVMIRGWGRWYPVESVRIERAGDLLLQ